MGARVVVARHVVVLAVDHEVAALDVVGVVDGLVHPIPNACAHAVAASFDGVPVFLQVAHGVAHGVGIFAGKVGLQVTVAVGVAFQETHLGIHRRIEIARVGPSARASLIMDGARVDGTHGGIGIVEVAAHTALVAQRPREHGGVIAVAVDHTHDAVHINRAPRRLVADARTAGERPVVVALHVGLVHAVEAVVVEHGVHLRLARVVGGADGVHVGLFHHDDVFQHRRHVDAAAMHGMRVLRIDAFEEDALTVDEHVAVFYLIMTEAIFCGEDHLIRPVAVFLRHDDGIERRCLGRPGLQA